MSTLEIVRAAIREAEEAPTTDLTSMLDTLGCSINTCHLLIKYVLDHHADAAKMVALEPVLELHVDKLDELAGTATSAAASKLVRVVSALVDDAQSSVRAK